MVDLGKDEEGVHVLQLRGEGRQTIEVEAKDGIKVHDIGVGL